jgi:hypothetical protein
VKFTQYFLFMRQRPDRASIKLEWIQRVIDHPEREEVQAAGRIRRWTAVPEVEGRYCEEDQILSGHRYALHRIQGNGREREQGPG